jgi:hypothetical protein
VTSLQAAAYAAEVCAAVSGALLARRKRSHRPAAVALALLAALNLLDAPILAALTPFSAEPWQGWSRVLVYLDGAINLGTSATIAGLAVAIAIPPEGARRLRAVAIVGAVWLAASVVLGALYPSPLVRGDGLQRVYFAADLIGLFVSTVALVTRARTSIAAKLSPTGADAIALGLVFLDASILLAPFSPWRAVLFGIDYSGPQIIITLFFATFAVAQVIAWRFSG